MDGKVAAQKEKTKRSQSMAEEMAEDAESRTATTEEDGMDQGNDDYEWVVREACWDWLNAHAKQLFALESAKWLTAERKREFNASAKKQRKLQHL